MSDTNNSSEAMQYPNSQVDKQLGVDESGNNWQYPSASASGDVEVVLPTMPDSMNTEQRLLAKDFGGLVAREIQKSLEANPYPNTVPTRKPTEVFRHYLGCAQGSGLLDRGALGRMAELAKEFEQTPEREAYFEYFEMVLKPYLVGLRPQRRS